MTRLQVGVLLQEPALPPGLVGPYLRVAFSNARNADDAAVPASGTIMVRGSAWSDGNDRNTTNDRKRVQVYDYLMANTASEVVRTKII